MREWVNSKKALKKVLKAEKCQSIYNGNLNPSTM